MAAHPAPAHPEPVPHLRPIRPVREVRLQVQGFGVTAENATLPQLMADLMASLGREADDPRVLPDSLVDSLSASILPHLAEHLHSHPDTPITGPAASAMLPFWLQAIEQAGEVPHLSLALKHPTADLHELSKRQQAEGLLSWISMALSADRATSPSQRSVCTTTWKVARPAPAFPALSHIALRIRFALMADDKPDLDQLHKAFAPVLATFPLLLRQWPDLGPARATLSVLRGRILPLLSMDSDVPPLLLAALGEIEVALLSQDQPQATHDLRRTRRLLRRIIRRPWPLLRLHLAHAGLIALQRLRPILSERRFHKLERSADKRDPAGLADRWAGATRTDRTRFYGNVRLPSRLAPETAVRPNASALPRLAVAVHAFYRDIYADILDRLALLDGVDFALFVTCPPGIAEDIGRMTVLAGMAATVVPVENCGRDVRPFFTLLPCIVQAGLPVILKLHTKKSTHRSDGTLWSGSIISSLTRPDHAKTILKGFATEPRLGLVAPRDHVLPVSPFLNTNGPHLRRLLAPADIGFDNLLDGVFTAGTMMFLRTDVAQSLAALISPDAFEPEQGQVDGTYAHAIERLFIVHAQTQGWATRDTDLRLI